MATKLTTKPSASCASASSNRAATTQSAPGNIVHFSPSPSSGSQDAPHVEAPAGLNFFQYALRHLRLVSATGGDCKGLFVEITESNGARLLYRLGSERVADELILLHEKAFAHDPEEIFTDRLRKLVLDYLRAKARHVADCRPVYKRLAWVAHEGAIYLDLSAPDGSCVRITPAQWVVVAPETPMFARFSTQQPLPLPVHSDEGPAAFVRMVPGGITPEGAKLLCGGMLGCLIPPNFTESFSFPVMVFRGDQGSGKSTLARLIKQMLDNETAPIAAKPTNADDIFVIGQTAHLLSYDNLVKIGQGISDAICQVTTGGAIVKRRLYTDSDQTILRAHSPFLLNGIGPLLQRPDIIDRSISIALKRIEEFDPEAGSDTGTNLPKVLGYLLDLMAKALANYSRVQLDSPPRAATLAKFVHAAEPFGCSTDFVTLLRRNQAELLTSVDEHHPVIDAIFELMAVTPTWTGTYKDLLVSLATKTSTETTRSAEWPKTERRLSPFLHSRKMTLREFGITFEQGPKRNNGRMLTLTATDRFAYSK